MFFSLDLHPDECLSDNEGDQQNAEDVKDKESAKYISGQKIDCEREQNCKGIINHIALFFRAPVQVMNSTQENDCAERAVDQANHDQEMECIEEPQGKENDQHKHHDDDDHAGLQYLES